MIVNQQLAASTGCDQKDLWATPAHIFNPLMDQFNFTLDPCAEDHTAKCPKYFTPFDGTNGGLDELWINEIVFCNPPYSRNNIDTWMKHAYLSSKFSVVVCLIPVSASAKWWHEYVVNKCQLMFYERRIRFDGAPFTAPFSSCLAIYGLGNINKCLSIKQ